MKSKLLLAIAVLVLGAAASAYAQNKPVKDMTPDERKALWESLSDEQKQRIVEQRAEYKTQSSEDAVSTEKVEKSKEVEFNNGTVTVTEMPQTTSLKPVSNMKNPGDAPTYVDINRDARKAREGATREREKDRYN